MGEFRNEHRRDAKEDRTASSSTALKTSRGSKPSPGKIIAEPCVTALKTPTTMPKQWNNGTGMQTLSSGRTSVMVLVRKPLLSSPKCVSVAPWSTRRYAGELDTDRVVRAERFATSSEHHGVSSSLFQ